MKEFNSCHCIANLEGRCVAEVCKGEIVGFDISKLSAELAKQLYEMSAELFEGETP